jgi:putative DNA primase/helicase
MARTVDRARGRWPLILAQLGVEDRYLRNKHGPCPLCGGKDRFRFDDKAGSGSYYCNQCGPGSGMTLVMKLHNIDFAEAARRVDAVLGDAAPRPPAAPVEDREGRRRRLQRLLTEATVPGVVGRYLRGRGLSVVPSILKGHPRLMYAEEGQRPAFYPAMLAPVLDIGGRLQSIHRTYIAAVAEKKKFAPSVDTVSGAAVRLFEPTDVLGVAEGIETAIAAHEIFGVPVWAGISDCGLAKVVIPPTVGRVLIFGDHDRNYAGHKAAYVLANRLAATGIDVSVKIPPDLGTDWLDVLVAQRGAAA